MAHQYSVDQAQAQFIQLLNEVEQGNPVELIQSGKRVAVVISGEEYDRLNSKKPDFWQAIEAFRRDFNIDEEGVDDAIWEGLRDPSPGREVNL
jgi:prevent-host-death family protein